MGAMSESEKDEAWEQRGQDAANGSARNASACEPAENSDPDAVPPTFLPPITNAKPP